VDDCPSGTRFIRGKLAKPGVHDLVGATVFGSLLPLKDGRVDDGDDQVDGVALGMSVKHSTTIFVK